MVTTRDFCFRPYSARRVRYSSSFHPYFQHHVAAGFDPTAGKTSRPAIAQLGALNTAHLLEPFVRVRVPVAFMTR